MPAHTSDDPGRRHDSPPAAAAPASTTGAAAADVPMTGISRTQDRANPLRRFMRTESASAGILMASVVIAVAWANTSPANYSQVWQTAIPAQLGPWRGSASAQEVVNQGLMTLFFLVVGLEARREFDLGDLRERRKAALPLVLGLAGMILPVGVFIAVNTGTIAMGGWGAAMSTDTALSLGALTVLGRAMPVRVRAFLLTVLVVDDIAALLVIAIVYSTDVSALPVAVALAAFAAYTLTQRLPAQGRQHVRVVLAITIWAGLLKGGVDPVVAGLLIGLATSAHTPSRGSLEEATAMVRRFREQPVPELARSAIGSLSAALSINTRLQYHLHPWTSRVVVPAFALANAGVLISWASIRQAAHSAVAVGIVLAYVVGKPVAIGGGSWVLSRFAPAGLRPHVGVGAALGTGTAAGIGLTVSLLVANLAFTGADLQNAKLAVLTAAALSALLTGVVFRALAALPETARIVAVHGTGREAVDLVEEPDNDLDHILGPKDAAVTVVEYGDFECGWTARSLPTTKELMRAHPDIRYVWRHLPLIDVHPHAELAAEAAEAAAAQGAFWPMQQALLEHQGEYEMEDLLAHARRIGLDVERFRSDLRERRHAIRVARDVESADASGVAGTPTFFINGRRHDGPPDLATLSQRVLEARARVRAREGALA